MSNRLERVTPPSDASTSALLEDAARRAQRYLAEVTGRAVAPSHEAVAALARFDEPLADQPADAQAVVALLDDVGSPATVASTGGRYFGFVTGGALPASVAASWVAATWDQNAAFHVMSPTAAMLEGVALRWVRDLLRLPGDAAGAITSGATMANLTGLAAARHAVLHRHGWDVERDGLFGAPPLQIVVGDEVHVSVLKALSLLGLGRGRVVRVPVDAQGRMRDEALPMLDDRTIVCVQAGNVNTGAFDPPGVIARAKAEGAWVHADGAFGLWAAASPRYAHLTAGYDAADSWSTDGHKWPNVGYDCGVAFVRREADLRQAMTVTAAYLAPSDHREPSNYTPEFSRRAHGVELWAALKSLGQSGVADLVERTCAHARRFAEGLRAAGYEVLNEVVINQVLVSFGQPEVTRAVIHELQREGTCWCGGTEWQGHTAMRISVSSWATTDEDVERSLEAMCRVARMATEARRRADPATS
jgi:glutamate/tyrosine decarboxylase-like PLP-dependent enzyme